jgi:hypothetical protein
MNVPEALRATVLPPSLTILLRLLSNFLLLFA